METLRHERRFKFWILLLVSIVGLIGSMVWGFLSYVALQDQLAAMPRSDVPGQLAIDVVEPQTLTIFYEDPTVDAAFLVESSGASMFEAAPVELTVVGPSGGRVETAPYERNLRFDYDGRVLTALATIEMSSTGTYTIDVAGDVPVEAQISVGHIVDVGLIASVIGVVGLFVASVVGIVVAVVMMAVRGGRRKSPERAERPLVDV